MTKEQVIFILDKRVKDFEKGGVYEFHVRTLRDAIFSIDKNVPPEYFSPNPFEEELLKVNQMMHNKIKELETEVNQIKTLYENEVLNSQSLERYWKRAVDELQEIKGK